MSPKEPRRALSVGGRSRCRPRTLDPPDANPRAAGRAYRGRCALEPASPRARTVTALLMLTLIAVAIGSSIAAVRIGSAEQAAVARLRESLLDQVRVLRTVRRPAGGPRGWSCWSQAAALGGSEKFGERLRDEVLGTLALAEVEFRPLPDVRTRGPRNVVLDPRHETSRENH